MRHDTPTRDTPRDTPRASPAPAMRAGERAGGAPWPDLEVAFWQLDAARRAIAEHYAILRGLRPLLPPHFERTCWKLDDATEELIGWREWARRRSAPDEGDGEAGAGEPPC